MKSESSVFILFCTILSHPLSLTLAISSVRWGTYYHLHLPVGKGGPCRSSCLVCGTEDWCFAQGQSSLCFVDQFQIQKVKSLTRVSLQPHGHQAPLFMGFSRQEYRSGLLFPSPGNFLTQGSNPGLPHCRQKLYHLSHQESHRTS